MKSEKGSTFFLSVALGRGREIPDEEFIAFAQGLSSLKGRALLELESKLSQEPWKTELERYRTDLEAIGESPAFQETVQSISGRVRTAESAMLGSETRTPPETLPLPQTVAHSLLGALREALNVIEQALSSEWKLATEATRSERRSMDDRLDATLEELEAAFDVVGEGEVTLRPLRSAISDLRAQNLAQRGEIERLRKALDEVNFLFAQSVTHIERSTD